MVKLGLAVKLNIPEDVTRDTMNFAKRVLGPLAEFGDLVSEQVRFFRYRSAMKTLKRAAEIAKDNGITPKELPTKFLVPFIEDCSLEEEDSLLIEEWASLLASASKGFDPLHVAIKDVLKNISAKEAELLKTLGSTIEPRLFDDNVSSYQIMDHVNVNIKGVIENHKPEIKIGMEDEGVDALIRELVALPVIPVFYHVPHSQGVTRTVDTNFSTTDKGSIFLLERLEILKSQEVRLTLSEDPQIADFVLSYAQLTPFGVEVFLQCGGLSRGVGPSRGRKRKASRKKPVYRPRRKNESLP
jgi:hypothetical protein